MPHPPHERASAVTRRQALLITIVPVLFVLMVMAVLPLTNARAASAQNLLRTSSHSIEDSTRGWSAQGNSQIERSTEYAAVGQSSLKVTVARNGWVDDSHTSRVGTTLVSTVPGNTYRGYARVLPGSDPAPVRCELRWYARNKSILSTYEGAPFVQQQPGSWVQTSCASTAPTGARYMALRIYIDHADYGDVHFVDDAWLTTGDAPPPPSPEEPGTTTTTTASERDAVNLLSADAQSLETSASGWAAQGNTSVSHTTDLAADGGASLKVLVAKNGWVDDSRTARVGTVPVAATAGATYSGSVQVRPGSVASPVRCELRFYDAWNNIVSTYESAPFVDEAADRWVHARCEASAPTGTKKIGLRVFIDDAVYGDVHYVDDAWLTTGSSDADSPDQTTTTTVAPTSTTTTTTTTAPTTTTTTTTVAPEPPASGDLPGASNTGVPAGTTLTPSGSITITEPGAVVDRLDVTGCIFVRADNVTIRRTRVRGSCWAGAIDTGYGEHSGILIEDVEIDGLRQNAGAALLGNSGFTCRRCNIHSGGSGIRMTSNVVIENSWIHDIYGAGDSHNSTIGSNGGSHFVIRGNNIDCGNVPQCSGALVLYGDFNPINDVLIENNLLNGGGYCTYGGSVAGKPYPNATNVRYLNNRFGRQAFTNCGYYGPVTSFDRNGTGNQWSGNVWNDTGAPL